ncbi:hypothetical protein AB4Y38_42845, partial [Paraburkholderia sp. EG285A]|uniref:hypothetical protein n=1 Tax=Paraburkholderia sp. EG285A TaxID=3237009 RepID=UPI0034D331EB
MAHTIANDCNELSSLPSLLPPPLPERFFLMEATPVCAGRRARNQASTGCALFARTRMRTALEDVARRERFFLDICAVEYRD